MINRVLSGEELVRKLVGVDITKVLNTFDVKNVSPSATQQAVNAAFSLAKLFQKCFDMTLNGAAALDSFRTQRTALAQLPKPTAEVFAEDLHQAVPSLVDPASTYLYGI